MPAIERIATSGTLTEQAHQSIKRFLLTGNLPAEEKLTEGFFADGLGISKSPVREALNALQNEGLLRIEPRKGIYLRHFTAKEISDLYELREALEVFATQVVPITPEFLASLEQSVLATHDLLARGDKNTYIEEDIAFHRLIVVSTGNEQLTATHSSIQDKLWLCRCQTYQITSPDTPAAHRAIAEAFRAGDREAAAAATRNHIRFVKDGLLRNSK